MKPTIGRIVRFTDTDRSEWPAIITAVHSDTLVSLQVFRIADVVVRTSVQLGEAGAQSTWHWPPRP